MPTSPSTPTPVRGRASPAHHRSSESSAPPEGGGLVVPGIEVVTAAVLDVVAQVVVVDGVVPDVVVDVSLPGGRVVGGPLGPLEPG